MVVVRERQANDGLSPGHEVYEKQRPRDLAGQAGGGIADDERAGDAPEDRVDVEVESSEMFGLVEERGSEAELSLCATVCLPSVSSYSPDTGPGHAALGVPNASRLRAHRSRPYLRLVECFLVNFLVQRLGDDGALQNAVLAEQQPVFESEFSEREADNQLPPREERPVQPAGQALQECLDHCVRLVVVEWSRQQLEP